MDETGKILIEYVAHKTKNNKHYNLPFKILSKRSGTNLDFVLNWNYGKSGHLNPKFIEFRFIRGLIIGVRQQKCIKVQILTQYSNLRGVMVSRESDWYVHCPSKSCGINNSGVIQLIILVYPILRVQKRFCTSNFINTDI